MSKHDVIQKTDATLQKVRTEPRPQKHARTANLVKIGRVVLEICSRTNRHKHTDMLITLLRHPPRRQSKNDQIKLTRVTANSYKRPTGYSVV